MPGVKPAAAKPSRVEPYIDLIWVWNAFWRLSASRTQGMNGPLRIGIGEVKAYADIYGYIPTKTREFLFYIDALDTRWMEHVEALREDEKEKRRVAQGDQTPRAPPRTPPRTPSPRR